MLDGYERVLQSINEYNQKTISFEEISEIILDFSNDIGHKLGYEGDFHRSIDKWIEYITYSYKKEDEYELGKDLTNFIQHAILDEPNPLQLPPDDRVVREHGLIDNKAQHGKKL